MLVLAGYSKYSEIYCKPHFFTVGHSDQRILYRSYAAPSVLAKGALNALVAD